ncbi:MAG: tRNA pseudouridine(55) synthase TruB [Desulfobacteraceae bacterium]|nr:tRNA pseudouridine(55) synthase TruB [Desulfobacteraceae bacterium]
MKSNTTSHFSLPTSHLNGLFVIDKPEDISSAAVVARLKKILGVRKAGHSGTLDPFATGVMVCCVNQATKLARFFLHSGKKYTAVLKLGVETDTQDSTGTVISRCEKVNFDEKKIKSVFEKFEGAIEQAPPIYSALKHKGVPLYKLARQGKPVQKPPRPVFISSLRISEINLPEISFEVSCSGGTYIRTLCADIGAELGCGGHLKELRRTESSGFSIDESVTLPELEKRVLSFRAGANEHEHLGMISMSEGLRNMPVHVADPDLAEKIAHGNIITTKNIIPGKTEEPEGFIKVVDTDNNLLAVLTYKKDCKTYNYCCVFAR